MLSKVVRFDRSQHKLCHREKLMGFLSKKNFKQLLGIVLSGLLLYAAFTNVKVSVLIDGIGDTRLIYVFLGIGAFIISYLIRALLWKTLLRKCNDITTYPLFKSVVIGQMGNNILPFRLFCFSCFCICGYYLGTCWPIHVVTIVWSCSAWASNLCSPTSLDVCLATHLC